MHAQYSATKSSDSDKDSTQGDLHTAKTISAVSSDNVEAQLKLAWKYARVDRDYASARVCFDQAAATGNEDAIVNRARFMQLRSVPEGIRDLRKLALGGNWKAQFWLGRHYQGRSSRMNQLRAAAWFDRAAKTEGSSLLLIAKFVQLVRVSSLLHKPVFCGQLIFEGLRGLRHMMRNPAQLDEYETLLYRIR